ncbi:HAD-IA family hydrolase [Cellulosimicrobium cellulans]|uniref:HAD-IA family hydrolase n=1 Tax=Cellulosimicrobium cellulans TaxID=1710 RepID=UPI0008490664|nr:HAD-IA family hydrolase [Cellulosimicrobium cellulans]
MPAAPTPGPAFADRTFDAVLFDMDGTLIDSVPAVDRCWRRWAAEQGLPGAETFQIPHGTPARTVIAGLLPPERVEAAHARIQELELVDNDGVTMLPGTPGALSALPAERQAIVTSCTRPLAEARMAASGLEARSVVVTADDVARGKPDPDPFLLGAEKLGVDPARCLVVEDAPAGIASARAAGCAVLAVTGTHSAAELAAASPAPDAVATGLDAVRFAVGPDGVRVTDA